MFSILIYKIRLWLADIVILWLSKCGIDYIIPNDLYPKQQNGKF